ncbi:MAG: methyltransferase type 11 [Bacteroidetes bacterium RBG_19FT_COMBO_42_10]|nr:MAG: methyltransferase type 11 [Bacteroidetes bacterium RBG_19FT_COMBO_42_10]
MQYEPIKRLLGRFISGPLFLRKTLYRLLDLLLLRTWHVKKALGKISRELPENAYILDAGSGLGQYTWRMCRMNKNWNITGIDIDSEQIEDCKRFFKKSGLEERTSFRTADLTTFEDPDAYHLILSVDVLEHIRDDEKVFLNFSRSLKQNGFLLLSTPSDKGGSDAHTDKAGSFIDEHVRNGYGIPEITDKLNRAGFRDIEAYYTYGKPGSISWHLTMKYPVKMLNVSYIFFIILPFYYLVFLPVSIILNIFDLSLTHKTGTGILVTARK